MSKWAKRALTALAIIVTLAALSAAFVIIVFPSKYKKEIETACAAYGVEVPLVQAVIWTESKYKPAAVSAAGAEGLMQLMPSTARFICERTAVEYDPELLTDPAYSIRLGVWYLSYLTTKFAGEAQVLAAYNAGEGTVAKWLAQGLTEIPYKETRTYVKRVINVRRLYRLKY